MKHKPTPQQFFRKQDGIETLARLKRWPSLKAKLLGKAVRIYSEEYQAYWRTNGEGYTEHEIAAAIFPFDEAWSMTHHCGPEKRITYRIVK